MNDSDLIHLVNVFKKLNWHDSVICKQLLTKRAIISFTAEIILIFSFFFFLILFVLFQLKKKNHFYIDTRLVHRGYIDMQYGSCLVSGVT